MNKLKLFVENILVYGLGGIINKVIPLIMIPVVTRLMPSPDYYGISDLSNTLTQFGSALAVMGMYDAMYRMFFEKKDTDYQRQVCSTTVIFTVSTSLIVTIIMIAFKGTIAILFFDDRQYDFIVYLSAMATLVNATNNIISAPTRMQNKRKVFLITNTISPLLSYLISIPLLLKGYYLIALPLAAVISGLIMEISFGIMNRSWFSIHKFDKRLLKQLLPIAIPLLPNLLIYWVFNSSDKIMITNILGVGAAGIYSVSSKLGHVSQLIYTAFAGGWQYFAFYTMKEETQVKTNSIIFEYLGIISFLATSFICAWSYFIFELLFPEQYWSGYIAAPYLFMAPLLQMLFQVAANQFIIIKKTWPNMFLLASGALINVVLNLCLIPRIGIEGAAIATLIGYFISDIICCIVLIKMKLMILSKKFMLAASIMFTYILIWRIAFSNNVTIGTISAVVNSLIVILIYKKEMCLLLKKIRDRV